MEQPTVRQVLVQGAYSEDEILELAASVEHRQTHPIARAICDEAAKRHLPIRDLRDIQVEVGYGLRAHWDGYDIAVGSGRLMSILGIELSEQARELQKASNAQGHSVVMVAIDGYLSGAIELESSIRPGADKLVRWLVKEGKSICIVSGDQEEPTRSLAAKLGIERYFATEKGGHVHKKDEAPKAAYVGALLRARSSPMPLLHGDGNPETGSHR